MEKIREGEERERRGEGRVVRGGEKHIQYVEKQENRHSGGGWGQILQGEGRTGLQDPVRTLPECLSDLDQAALCVTEHVCTKI